MLEHLTAIAEGDSNTMTDKSFSEIDIRIGRIKYLLKSIETRKKIAKIIDGTVEDSGLSKSSKYHDQDATHRKYCYECKTKIRSDKYRHIFYRSMCILCGNINMFKRDIKSNQNGKVAVSNLCSIYGGCMGDKRFYHNDHG